MYLEYSSLKAFKIKESPMNPDIHDIGLPFLIWFSGPFYPHWIPVFDLPFCYKIMFFLYCEKMMATDMQYPRQSLHMRAHGTQALDVPYCIQLYSLSIPYNIRIESFILFAVRIQVPVIPGTCDPKYSKYPCDWEGSSRFCRYDSRSYLFEYVGHPS